MAGSKSNRKIKEPKIRKVPFATRLAPEAVETISTMSESLGIPQSQILEQSIALFKSVNSNPDDALSVVNLINQKKLDYIRKILEED